LFLKNDAIHLAITGSVGSQIANCDLVIDYAQPSRALLSKFVVQEDTEEVSVEDQL